MCARKEHNKERRCLSGKVCNDMFCHPQGDLTNGDLSPKHVGRFKVIMYNLQFYCVHVWMYVNNSKHSAQTE
jgi:hypothetical protein